MLNNNILTMNGDKCILKYYRCLLSVKSNGFKRVLHISFLGGLD